MTPSPTSSLPRRSPLQSWLLGSAAAGAAVSAHAEIVQIDLDGNQAFVGGRSLNNFTNPDLTGDGIDDLVGKGALSFTVAKASDGIRGYVAGVPVGADFSSSTTSDEFRAFIGRFANESDDSPVTARAFIPVTFTDARINGGAPTNGLLDVIAFNHHSALHTIALVRLVFDDESTAEPTGAVLASQYAAWSDVTTQSRPMPSSNAAKNNLKKRIAKLEQEIRKLKATSFPNSPRFNFFQKQNAERLRKIAALEAQLAQLRRHLGRRSAPASI